MTEQRPLSPMEQIRRAYEETEQRTSQTMEELVSSQGFAEILSMMVGNAMSVSRISGSVLDDLIRRTHLAGRSDLTGVGRQIGRAEDKLELVLQRIESLESEVRALREELADRPAASRRAAASNNAPVDEADESDDETPRPRRRATRATTKKAAVPRATAVAAVAARKSVTAPAGEGA